jgi:hypothetical protein
MNMTQVQARKARTRSVRALALVLCVLGASLAHAQAIPSNLRAAILLRALQYEKVFASSSETALVVVLVGSGSRDGTEMTAALKQLASAGAIPRKVSVEEVREANTPDLQKKKPAVLYVAEGNEAALGAAAGVAGALVLCGDPNVVGKGCVLSVEAAGSSSRLVIDLATASKKGFTFDARMLRVARVIR